MIEEGKAALICRGNGVMGEEEMEKSRERSMAIWWELPSFVVVCEVMISILESLNRHSAEINREERAPIPLA